MDTNAILREKQEVTEMQPPKDKKKCLERRNINNGNKRQNRLKKKGLRNQGVS